MKATGWLKTRIRVRYAETDQMGVVYYANFFVWFEIGRSELLRQIGLPYSLWERKGVRYVVVAAHCDYFNPARYDEELIIKTRIQNLGEKSLRYRYRIERSADSRLMAEGYTVHVLIDKRGRPIRVPLWIRRGLSKPNYSEGRIS